MGAHEVEFGGRVVRRHEQVTLVLIRCWVCAGGLCGGGETLEIKLVGVSLAVNLGHDVLVVVIPGRRKEKEVMSVCVSVCVCYEGMREKEE